MNYQVKRLDFTWLLNTGTMVGVVIGMIVSLVGYRSNNLLLMGAGGVVFGGAIVAITRPVLSGLLAILGLFGGLLTFFLVPNPEVVNMPLGTRMMAAILFTALYTVLMDTLLVVGSLLYNVLTRTVGLQGIVLEVSTEESAEEPQHAAEVTEA